MLALLRLESTCNSKFNFCLIIRVLCARSRETYDNGGERGLLLIRGNVFSTCTTAAFVYRAVMSLTDTCIARAKKQKKIIAFDEESNG